MTSGQNYRSTSDWVLSFQTNRTPFVLRSTIIYTFEYPPMCFFTRIRATTQARWKNRFTWNCIEHRWCCFKRMFNVTLKKQPVFLSTRLTILKHEIAKSRWAFSFSFFILFYFLILFLFTFSWTKISVIQFLQIGMPIRYYALSWKHAFESLRACV